MTKFKSPKDVLDDFHRYMGSGLSVDYHKNGIPRQAFVDELAQRDERHNEEKNVKLYEDYLNALLAQKKLLQTHEGKLFTYSQKQKSLLEEKKLLPPERPRTHWRFVALMFFLGLLILFVGAGSF